MRKPFNLSQVMLKAWDLYRERKANLARRSPHLAKYRKWRGEEASFCLRTAWFRCRTEQAEAEACARVHAENARHVASMDRRAVENRLTAIDDEIARLDYADWGVDIRKTRAHLQSERIWLLTAPSLTNIANAA